MHPISSHEEHHPLRLFCDFGDVRSLGQGQLAHGVGASDGLVGATGSEEEQQKQPKKPQTDQNLDCCLLVVGIHKLIPICLVHTLFLPSPCC